MALVFWPVMSDKNSICTLFALSASLPIRLYSCLPTILNGKKKRLPVHHCIVGRVVEDRMRDKQEERVVGPRTKNRFGAIRFPKMCFCETQGSLFFLISVYPYLEKTPNFNRFYKKTGSILQKKLRCDKFGN